jgi:hypothetical protein
MSTLELKELSHPSGEVIKIAAGKTLDLKSQGTTTLPTGSVLQVIQTTSNTATELTAVNTWTTVGTAATITPTSASSKILVMHSAGGLSNGSNASFGFQLLRGSTAVSTRSRYGYTAVSGYTPINWDFKYLDSPNTTSAITYNFQIRLTNAGNIRHCDNESEVTNNDACTTILMEIQG